MVGIGLNRYLGLVAKTGLVCRRAFSEENVPMLKRYTFWVKAAILFLFLTASAHSLSFFVSPELKNDQDRQLHNLLHNYYEDMGAGFHRSFFDLFTALSACYPLLCVLAGLTLGYLLWKRAEPGLMKGILLINVFVSGVCLVVMAVFAFLPPIVMTGLIFSCLLAAYFLCPRTASAA